MMKRSPAVKRGVERSGREKTAENGQKSSKMVKKRPKTLKNTKKRPKMLKKCPKTGSETEEAHFLRDFAARRDRRLRAGKDA